METAQNKYRLYCFYTMNWEWEILLEQELLGVLNLENGYRDVRRERHPFSRSLSHSTRPPFHHFSVPQDPHFNQESQNFPIFCLVNFQFPTLKFGQNPVQEASFGPKISSESSIFDKIKISSTTSQQTPKFGADLCYKPLFWNSSAAQCP